MKLLASLLLLSGIAFPAKDNRPQRIFDLPYDQVWKACVTVAGENYVVVMADKENGLLTFKNPEKNWRIEYEVGVFVDRVKDNQTKVILTLKRARTYSFFDYGKGGLAAEYLKLVDQKLHPPPEKQ